MSFSADLNRFNKKTQKKIERVFRGSVLGLFTNVILRTPVLNGRLVANWNANIGSMPGGTTKKTDPTRAATVAKAQAVAFNLKFGDVVYLINNLEYAIPIEYGHSKDKRPEGMVRVSVKEFKSMVNKEARKR